ncbi:hypothetical protein FRB99_008252 [Tulasnella sp. 403]|nr:hypothetical protein FRB99_008252 [Tulasnella sp. 403]
MSTKRVTCPHKAKPGKQTSVDLFDDKAKVVRKNEGDMSPSKKMYDFLSPLSIYPILTQRTHSRSRRYESPESGAALAHDVDEASDDESVVLLSRKKAVISPGDKDEHKETSLVIKPSAKLKTEPSGDSFQSQSDFGSAFEDEDAKLEIANTVTHKGKDVKLAKPSAADVKYDEDPAIDARIHRIITWNDPVESIFGICKAPTFGTWNKRSPYYFSAQGSEYKMRVFIVGWLTKKFFVGTDGATARQAYINIKPINHLNEEAVAKFWRDLAGHDYKSDTYDESDVHIIKWQSIEQNSKPTLFNKYGDATKRFKPLSELPPLNIQKHLLIGDVVVTECLITRYKEKAGEDTVPGSPSKSPPKYMDLPWMYQLQLYRLYRIKPTDEEVDHSEPKVGESSWDF